MYNVGDCESNGQTKSPVLSVTGPHGAETISAVQGKDVYFLPLVARRRVLAPTSERSTVLGFALRGIKNTSFPVEAFL